MIDLALAALRFRCSDLRIRLGNGSEAEVSEARERLRLSLVELHHLGYWRDHPEEFRKHMHLFRVCRQPEISVPPSMSVPDRTALRSL